MKNVRIFDNVYTHRVFVQANNPNNNSSPIYFQSSYNVLENKFVKALTVTSDPSGGATGRSINPAPWYLTLVDMNDDILLYNYPLTDLTLYDYAGTVNEKIRLFNLYNVNIRKSYFIVSGGTGWGINTNLFNLNFYY